jgi:hypothetical protein
MAGQNHVCSGIPVLDAGEIYPQWGTQTQPISDCVYPLRLLMEKILRLEWKKDPAGYRIEERKEGQSPGYLQDSSPEGLTPYETWCRRRDTQRGGMFLVPRSGRLENYSHNFDKTKLIFLELENAVNLGLSICLPGEDESIWLKHVLRDKVRLPGEELDFQPAVLNLRALVDFATNWGLPNVHHEAHVGEFGFSFAPELPAIRERVGAFASDGSRVCVYRLASTLRGFCQHEYAHAIQTLKVPIGRCHYCGKLFARRLKRGDRKDKHEFCPESVNQRGKRVRGKCRHDFNNQKAKEAAPAFGIAGEPSFCAAGRA